MVSTNERGGHHARGKAERAAQSRARVEEGCTGRMPRGSVGCERGDGARAQRQSRAQVASARAGQACRGSDAADAGTEVHPAGHHIARTAYADPAGMRRAARTAHRTAPRRNRRDGQLADVCDHRVRRVAARAAAVIRIDALWLAAQPVDMRAGADRLLARVVQVFGCAQAHHGYLFANARATRIKLLVHDGFGVWCAARRLNEGRFVWPREAPAGATPMVLTQAQFDALALGRPWQRLEQMKAISRM